MRPKTIIALNIGLIVGCVAALFMVPPSTPVRLFIGICVGIIVLSNGALAVSARLPKTDPAVRRAWFERWQSWIAIAFLLLLEFLFSHRYVPNLTVR